jgi:aldehyde dehydrogenase (NAD+)
MGRPLSTYFDGFFAASIFDHYAEATWPKGETSLNTKGFLNLTLRQPIGVVGAIIPWNVPIILLAHKLGMYLLASCRCTTREFSNMLKVPHLLRVAQLS